MSDDVFDLDSLIPAPRTVKFGDQIIEIKAPTTEDVLKLGFLGQKLQKADELADVELQKLVVNLKAHVVKIIPELEGKDLNTAQLLKLIEIISDMSMPSDAKELKERGITPTGPKVQ